MPVRLTTDTKNTPQTEAARADQVENTAGGFTFQLDPWDRLDRFLILGTEGGTMYVSQGTLSRENARNVQALIREDEDRVFERVKAVSVGGLAYKQDYALFVLTLLMTDGTPAVKARIADELPSIARTGSHLFTFLSYVTDLRGWGRALRRAVGNWYLSFTPDRLAYQLVKYQQRAGWTHRDALRVTHPKPTRELQPVFSWVTQGKTSDDLPALIHAFEGVTERNAPEFVQKYGLPREALPTEALRDPSVWRAMLERGMPMTALIRNLAVMTRNGTIKPMNDAEDAVVHQITDGDAIRKARVHPIQVLAAALTYHQGHGTRGRGEWTPTTRILEALDGAFYASFENVEPTNQRVLVALDVSGSMGMGEVGGVPGLTPRVASAALALVFAATEPKHHIVGFASHGGQASPFRWSALVSLGITARSTLQEAEKAVSDIPFGGTDCSLPMLHAMREGLDVDTFIVLTDNETWAGRVHPFEALREYRRQSGINARLAVVGMTATDFTIADPTDDGMMDFVGFSPNLPQALRVFMER